MPVDDRSHRAPLKISLADSPPLAGRSRHESVPLAHVLCALIISSASILLALWTFSADAPLPFAERTVHAEDSQGQLVSSRSAVPVGGLLVSPMRIPGDAGSHGALKEVLPGTDPVYLHGKIVDSFRHPIPFATLWLDLAPWRVWAEADAKGNFNMPLPDELSRQLREASGSLRIAARAPKHSPSQVLTLDSPPRAELCFVLEQGAARLRLEVVDHAGLPLAGVLVNLAPAPGNPRLASSGVLNQEWMPTPPALTDAWGLLRLDGLAPGEQELRLELQGYSQRQGRLLLIKDEICGRVIELRRSAAVRGVLLRADGGPLGDATVRATSAETLQSFMVRVDARGQFLLSDLPAGAVSLLAESHNNAADLFEARSQLSLACGQLETWNPVLRPVRLIHGRLLDSSGRPLAGWRVETRERDRRLQAETDENGAYALPAPEQSTLSELAFFHPAAGRGFPTRLEAMTLREEQVDDLVLEPGEAAVARVTGRVLLPSGQPAVGETLVLQRKHDRIYVPLSIDQEGYFASPPLPPGLYVPVFPQHGLGWTPDQALRVEGYEQVDLGTFQLPQLGRLSLLTSTTDRYTQKFNMALDLLRPGIEEDFRLPIFAGMLEVPLDLALAPGTYELNFPGEGVDGISFQIESGANTLAVLTPPK